MKSQKSGALRPLKTVIGGLILVLGFVAEAQQYSITWSKIAGGGVATPSIGGIYAVRGTIGQHDASTPLTNGLYSVTGGFWVLPRLLQTPGAPRLTVAPGAPGQATLSWWPALPGFVLQETSSLETPNWVNSPSGTANPVNVPAIDQGKYYRLLKP